MDFNALLVKILGPFGALVLAVWFCWYQTNEFKKVTTRLFDVMDQELNSCNQRYEMVLSELMKIKNEKGGRG